MAMTIPCDGDCDDSSLSTIQALPMQTRMVLTTIVMGLWMKIQLTATEMVTDTMRHKEIVQMTMHRFIQGT